MQGRGFNSFADTLVIKPSIPKTKMRKLAMFITAVECFILDQTTMAQEQKCLKWANLICNLGTALLVFGF